jgi:hypothetical protein
MAILCEAARGFTIPIRGSHSLLVPLGRRPSCSPIFSPMTTGRPQPGVASSTRFRPPSGREYHFLNAFQHRVHGSMHTVSVAERDRAAQSQRLWAAGGTT